MRILDVAGGSCPLLAAHHRLQVVDFSRPWNALDTLDRWSVKLLELLGKLDADLLEKLKKARVDAYQT
jgi:hypothetical protein